MKCYVTTKVKSYLGKDKASFAHEISHCGALICMAISRFSSGRLYDSIREYQNSKVA